MKASELKNSSTQELEQKIITLQEDLFGLRMKNASGQLADKAKIRIVRRDIARVLTILNDKQSEGE